MKDKFIKILVVTKHAFLNAVFELRPINPLISVVIKDVEKAFCNVSSRESHPPPKRPGGLKNLMKSSLRM